MAVLPANPKVIGSKPYTGNSDGAAAGPRAGMDEWIRQAIKHGGGGLALMQVTLMQEGRGLSTYHAKNSQKPTIEKFVTFGSETIKNFIIPSKRLNKAALDSIQQSRFNILIARMSIISASVIIMIHLQF